MDREIAPPPALGKLRTTELSVDRKIVSTFVGSPSMGDLVHLLDPLVDYPGGVRCSARKLAVFVTSYESGAALASIPLYGIAELGPPDDGSGRPGAGTVLLRFPLGVVGTDHVGYASFDLSALVTSTTAEAVARAAEKVGRTAQGTAAVLRLCVLPFADESLAIDALTSGEDAGTSIAVRIELDQDQLAEHPVSTSYVAMQDPGINDWRLSPSSFSLPAGLMFGDGDGGCESFLPTNLATQSFGFTQVARVRSRNITPRAGEERHPISKFVRPGLIFEYRSEWFPVGHSLGRVLYTLPLAPAEKVKIAIIDWSREDSTKRTEDTKVTEQLVNDWSNDRSLSETVHATVQEWQRGGSVMGGLGISGSSGMFGGALSLGGGYTTSSGTRQLTADTQQEISQVFHQVSSSMRDLHSTVIVNSYQAERAGARTRTVANYNHSHAMTILYYEVLRHYRIVTRCARVRPALMVRYTRSLNTTDDVALARWVEQNRVVVESVLRDPDLVGAVQETVNFASLERTFKQRRTGLGAASELRSIQVSYQVRADTRPTHYLGFGIQVPKHGETIWCAIVVPGVSGFSVAPVVPGDPAFNLSQHLGDWIGGSDGALEPGKVHSLTLVLPDSAPHIRWDEVSGVRLFYGQRAGQRTGDPPANLALDFLTVETVSDGTAWTLIDSKFFEVPPDTTPVLAVSSFDDGPETAWDSLSAMSQAEIRRLKAHLASNAGYYERAVWRAEDPADRADRFEEAAVDANTTLLDLVDNRLVEVVGDWGVFPVAGGAVIDPSGRFRFADRSGVLGSLFASVSDVEAGGGEFAEQLVALPSRGVFAEAKLGHCNASERIDETRFWDWQTSPIPDDAPGIAPVDTASRYQTPTGTTPTELPAGLVNIVNPPSLPDPTGLQQGLAMMAAMGGFRDMSGVKELADLLKTVSNNATALAGKGAKGQSSTPDPGTGGETPGGGKGGGDKTSAPAQTNEPQQESGHTDSPKSSVGPGTSGTGGAVTSVGGESENPVCPPVRKPVRAQPLPPANIVFTFILQEFGAVGGVRGAWGSVMDDMGHQEWFKQESGVTVRVATTKITGDGSGTLVVQLGDSASTSLTGGFSYNVATKGAKQVTLIVTPYLMTTTVRSKTALAAKEAAAKTWGVELAPGFDIKAVEIGGKGTYTKTESGEGTVAIEVERTWQVTALASTDLKFTASTK